LGRLSKVAALGFVLGGLLLATAIVMPASSFAVNPFPVRETAGASHLGWSGGSSEANPIVWSGPTNAATAPTNVSYCELLGPNPGMSADLPTWTINVSVLWHKLCVQTAFVAAVNEWSSFYLTYAANETSNVSYWAAGNLTVGAGGHGDAPPLVSFFVFHGADCNNTIDGPVDARCNYEEDWNGNVSTNNLTGPYFLEYLTPPCSCGLDQPPTTSGFPLLILLVVLGGVVVGVLGTGLFLIVRRKGPPRGPTGPN
jgi:hypothetical protein